MKDPKDQADDDNHANQLNPNNDEYDGDDNEKEHDYDNDNHSNQMNPNNDEYRGR
ncbi:MAG: hypothetical protein JWO44_961 [Bacteroidetes bacterium]|nr:hypothetical protein [Bacteroidota bacterium]